TCSAAGVDAEGAETSRRCYRPEPAQNASTATRESTAADREDQPLRDSTVSMALLPQRRPATLEHVRSRHFSKSLCASSASQRLCGGRTAPLHFYKTFCILPVEAKGNMPPHIDLPQGTLDLLILRTLSLGPQHGWGISERVQQMSSEVLRIQQ